MPVIRTPDSRFENLIGYPFEPHYVHVNGLRMHYIEAGSGPIILCLHGEPTWSYLYRRVIPTVSSVGRVIAPDLVGFGKSDKFTDPGDYSFQMHRDLLVGFIEALALRDITLVVHDWGGLLGLRLAAEMPQMFSRLVILNTFLPTGEERPNFAFRVWRRFAKSVPRLPIGRIIRMSTTHHVSDDILRGYEAPFPDETYKAGARILPELVPIRPDMPGAKTMLQTRAALREWSKPALVMFSDKDPLLGSAFHFFRELIPTARDQPETIIHDAGHFLQEDKGEEIARHILAFLRRTSLT